ncbi:hypothetical protein B9Z65_7843 [Elsinoe australis]|uniref:RecF/RecN/SMC N-terminal domain-containing protein n=1 Tax=Elsinoe australis TaxID=40998 RepID=A0A2P8A0N7_9PEZI|nr:hypothetical protein B9Z65_7843 [Elsinoe australis]
MAPNKRRRTLDDDGESDRKKSRIARAHENGGSAVSDVDSQDEPDTNMDGNKDNDDNDDNESVLEDDIMKQMQEDQDFDKLMDNGKANKPAEYGVIEEVHCSNFMCHERLTVTLGPLINFIIGHNGSGKSAVLTALTLCLGAKATATNRGTSLKNFIKEGKDNAMVSVRVKNQGELAYQHDLYGDQIRVERHFNRNGQSGFKIKNSEGRLITTKKGDLEDMLDYLGLQLDNPMNVLSQDLARQFLSNSSPHDKYKFFLKGTQLEQLDRDYRMMADYVDQAEAKLETRKGDIDHLKAQVAKAEQKKKESEQAETIGERIRHLEWMHAWAQVEEQERNLAQAEEAVTKADETIARRRYEAEQKSEDYTSKNANLEAAKAVKEDTENELRPVADERDKIKEEFDKNKQLLLQNQTQLRHIQTDIRSAKNEMKKFEDQIAAEEQRIQEASGPAQAEKLEELRNAEEDARQKKDEFDSFNDKRPLERERDSAKADVDAKLQSMQPAEQAIRDAETRLQDLQRNRNDRVKAYNPNTSNLLRAVQNERRFKDRPVGPLGLHVKLLKPEWSSVVETTFGQVLESFVVTNSQDQSILRELQQRNNCHGDIYIGNPRPLDIRENKAQTDYDTLLDVLDIEHDIIRNQFIINQSAEQVILVPDRQTGADLNSSTPRPRNVKVVLTMHDTLRGEGHRFSTTANGSRVDRVKPWTRNARMQTNVEAQIAAQRENVADAKRKLDSHRQELRQLEEKLKRANQALNRFAGQARDLRIAMQQAEDHVIDIRQQLESYKIDAGTLDSLKDSLKDAKETHDMYGNSYQDAIEEKDRLNEAQRTVKTKLDTINASAAELEKKLEKVVNAIKKHDDARTQALKQKNLAIGFLEEAEKAKESAEQDKAQLKETVEYYEEEASKVHPRIEVDAGMTTDRIDKKIERLQQERHAARERVGGTREEIVARWSAAKAAYREGSSSYDSLYAVKELLKKAYVKRISTWRDFRKHIMARAKIMFALLLRHRKFKGRLMSDHDARSLDIMVEPDVTKTSDKGRQTKTLSGGEKSFSTICLLLAIWEAMGSPIRCLDEFDVFMDNVNRDTSMRMMIQAARAATGKQYILITPQSMNNINVENDMRIHKMSDPERGRTALPFGS